MATIQKRNDTYRIRVSSGYDVHGKQIMHTRTWKPEPGMTERQIKKELERQAVLFEEECLSGYNVKSIKFEDFTKQWFKEYAELRLKPNTITFYHSMEPRIFKSLGHIRMDRLTPHDIQKFIVELTQSKRFDNSQKNGGRLSTKSIDLYRTMISTICSYAVRMNVIRDNPCRNITIPKIISPEKEVYTLEEAQKMLELFAEEDESNYQYVCFYSLAVYTGFRQGELLGLEWKDIDFDKRVISVRRTSIYNKSKGGMYTETPKTAQSLRSLKVPEVVIDILKKWKRLQNEQREMTGDMWTDTDRVFTKWNGEPMHRDCPRRYFITFCKRTGMRYVSCHSMRHLNATLLINAGVDVKTVQTCLGHSSPTTTMRVYLHTFQSAQAAASEAVASALSFSPKSDAGENRSLKVS